MITYDHISIYTNSLVSGRTGEGHSLLCVPLRLYVRDFIPSQNKHVMSYQRVPRMLTTIQYSSQLLLFGDIC